MLRVEGYADRSAGSPPQVWAAALALVPADLLPPEDKFPPITSTTTLEDMMGHTLSAAISDPAIDEEEELQPCAFGSGLAGTIVEGTNLD